MFYCGIDIAKYKHEATVIGEAGAALLDSISFSNSKEGCEKLDLLNEDLLINMAATGHYWLSVYGYPLEQGFEVKVINLLSVSTRKLSNLLEKTSRGRLGKEKAEGMKSSAPNSFGVSFAKDAFAFQMRQSIQQPEFLEGQITELEGQISSLLKQTGSYITTISGIGDTLGAIILGEIGDIHRFDAPNKLVAFAGLDARVSQFSEFTGTRQKISKRGSPYLRRAVWLAASRAAFCDPILSEYYHSLRTREKHHLTAIGAVSRKLCNTTYTILKEDRPWRPAPPRGKKESNNIEQ